MKTIVLTTLFLGLTAGVQTVEVAVDENVAAVELTVDGETVRRLSEPPWRTTVDFGKEPALHHLAAVALDGEGAEIGRSERWLNLSIRPAEARLWVEHDDEGRAVRGGLAWESQHHRTYRSLLVTFDGEPLPVDDPGSFELQPHDPEVFHVLSAEVGLPDGTSVRADVAFGGVYGEELATELTGVPVSVDGKRRLRRTGDAGPWLRVDGEPRPVLAVDAEGGDLYVVMDRSAHNPLVELGAHMARRLGERRVRVREVEDGDGVHKVLVLRPPVKPSPLRQVGLHPDDRLFLVRPVAGGSVPGYSLFGISHPLTDEVGGSAWQLTFRRFPDDGVRGPQLLAEAVATAGVRAAGGGRPRAVVLILGPGGEDESSFTPPGVRRYLESLRVPLEVWFVDLGDDGDAGDGEEAGAARSRRLEAARRAWGEDVKDVAGLSAWIEVNRALQRRLQRQRILWIDGFHPPPRVELADTPPWLQPVGAMVE